MKVLGIDFGLAKIGLAMADDSLAQPLKVVSNGERGMARIARVVRQEQIERIVVGVSEGKMGQKAREYGRDLGRITGVEVVFQDETLTTQEAIAKMVEAGKRKKYRQEKEDAFAAALILQSYLDKT